MKRYNVLSVHSHDLLVQASQRSRNRNISSDNPTLNWKKIHLKKSIFYINFVLCDKKDVFFIVSRNKTSIKEKHFHFYVFCLFFVCFCSVTSLYEAINNELSSFHQEQNGRTYYTIHLPACHPGAGIADVTKNSLTGSFLVTRRETINILHASLAFPNK